MIFHSFQNEKDVVVEVWESLLCHPPSNSAVFLLLQRRMQPLSNSGLFFAIFHFDSKSQMSSSDVSRCSSAPSSVPSFGSSAPSSQPFSFGAPAPPPDAFAAPSAVDASNAFAFPYVHSYSQECFLSQEKGMKVDVCRGAGGGSRKVAVAKRRLAGRR